MRELPKLLLPNLVLHSLRHELQAEALPSFVLDQPASSRSLLPLVPKQAVRVDRLALSIRSSARPGLGRRKRLVFTRPTWRREASLGIAQRPIDPFGSVGRWLFLTAVRSSANR